MVANPPSPRFRSSMPIAVALSRARRGSFDRFARDLLALGMGLEFMKPGDEHLGQVALVVLLTESDRFVDLPLFQAFCHGRGESAGLLPCLSVGDPPFDHDTDRVGRHDGKHEYNALGDPSHRVP